MEAIPRAHRALGYPLNLATYGVERLEFVRLDVVVGRKGNGALASAQKPELLSPVTVFG